jgi:hypothetical protein
MPLSQVLLQSPMQHAFRRGSNNSSAAQRALLLARRGPGAPPGAPLASPPSDTWVRSVSLDDQSLADAKWWKDFDKDLVAFSER